MSDLQDIANILNIDNSENSEEIELEIELVNEIRIVSAKGMIFSQSGVYKLSTDLILYLLVYL